MDALQSQEERRRRIQERREARQRQQNSGVSDGSPVSKRTTPPQAQSVEHTPQPSAPPPRTIPQPARAETSTDLPQPKRPRWERQQAQFEANLRGKPAEVQEQLKSHMGKLISYRKQLRQKRDENRRRKDSLPETPELGFCLSRLHAIRARIISVEETAASLYSETLGGVLPADPQGAIVGLANEMANIAKMDTEYQNKLFELQDTRNRVNMARRAQASTGPQHSQYFPMQTGPAHPFEPLSSETSGGSNGVNANTNSSTPQNGSFTGRTQTSTSGTYVDPNASYTPRTHQFPGHVPAYGFPSAGYTQNPYTPTFEGIPTGPQPIYPGGLYSGLNIPTPEPGSTADFGGSAGHIEEHDIDAIFEHAHSKIKPVDIPKEMNVSILEHQRQGLAWLLHQEESKNKGGILADDMGLGKTVQTICLIYANPPGPEVHERNSATLIVCPLALLDTWSSDLKERVHRQYRHKVYIHHSKHNARTSNMARVCRNNQVVITTYEAIANEHKDLDKNGKSHPLFDVTWHRVVLDEAHLIKNHASQRSKAVAELKATHRLCLSGTPMQNNLGELWPMLRFLKIAPYCNDRMRFKQLLPAKPKHDEDIDQRDLNEKLDKLRLFLASILLRRTKDTEINGVKILANLPAKLSFEINVTMSSKEQADYTAFEDRIKRKAQDLMDEDNSDVISNILVLLLRLRQRTCHPELPKITSKPWKLVPLQASHSLIQQAKNMTREARAMALRVSGVENVDIGEVKGEPATSAKSEPGTSAKSEPGMSTKSEPGSSTKSEPGTSTKSEPGKSTRSELKASTASEVESLLGTKRQCSHCDELFTLNNIFIMDPCGHSICPPCFNDLQNDDTNAEETEDGLFCPRCNEEVASKAIPYALIKIVHRNPRARNEDIQREYMGIQKQERAAIRAGEAAQQAKLKTFLNGIHSRASLNFEDDDEEFIQPLGSYQDVEISGSQTDALVPVGSELPAPSKRAYFFTRGLYSGQGGLPDDFGNIQLRIADPAQIDVRNRRYDEDDINKIARLFYRSNCFKNGWSESTKCNAVLETLYDVWSEAPGDKIIIFSFFTSFLDVLTIPLDAAGIKYIMYTGELDIEERDDALRRFKNTDCKVLLISLRAGNVGLTLTAANRVFIVEPFWNPYVEDQAKDRVHRIGQSKEVRVYRFIIKGTVEDRIVQLQQKKRIMIESALDKNARDKVMSMSKENILFALGLRERMR